MATNPINLIIRFILEITVLVVSGMWGWRQSGNWTQYLLAIGIPILLAATWGIFAVPGDPSRSGSAPVVTPGLIRLILELGFFAVAAWMLFDMGFPTASLVVGVVTVLHYAVSHDRVIWLLSN